MSLSALIQRLMRRTMRPPVIGLIDTDSISRSLSRYTFIAKSINGLSLDIGSGSCFGTNVLKRQGKIDWIVGVDIDIDLLRYGKLVYNIKDLVVADARFLPFRHEAFDSIACLELIEHLREPDQFKLCQKLYNILKRGG